MKKVRIRVTNYTKRTTEDVWFAVGGSVRTDIDNDDTPIGSFEVMEIVCDEEHPVKHETWGYDG